MATIYDIHRYGRWVFLTVAALVVAFFLVMSNRLINDLSTQEHERMEIWANATKEIISVSAIETTDSASIEAISSDIDFLWSIIEGNTTIPVLLTDDQNNILQYRNFTLPDPVDENAFGFDALSQANKDYLRHKLDKLSITSNVIYITITPGLDQRLYYEDSTMLKRLSYYPFVQLAVMIVFIAVVYFAVAAIKRAEQDKVWVGLSKETAHQLGTPISSLMAWMELLPDLGVDADTVGEMNKDVQRLSTIASRFSKIGSKPQMEEGDLSQIVSKAAAYMSTRVSPRITFSFTPSPVPLPVKACAPLLEWVMENLIKNAVDAMEGAGSLTVTVDKAGDKGVIDVTDTGKGIRSKDFDNVFSAGYTTKKRGWGLGLTLAKRIIKEYHKGRIFVKSSTLGKGTTFRIEIPLQSQG